jgi:hypothetical protein
LQKKEHRIEFREIPKTQYPEADFISADIYRLIMAFEHALDEILALNNK